MMKPFVFITDFDGTMSEKDFYGIIIDEYIGEEGKQFYVEWRKNNKVDVPFLNKVFSWHKFEEEELQEVLEKVKIDPFASELYHYVQMMGGNFLILSAGFNYYIKRALERNGLEAIPLITNEGVHENGIFIMKPDETKSYFSPIYGVDKEKVVLEHKKTYEKVFFAGDSEPDFKAALAADVVFAKGELRLLLDEAQKPYYSFSSFSEVIKILKEVLSYE